MDARKCAKCGTVFQYPSQLERHLTRKTSCEPILNLAQPAGAHACKYCNRPFTTAQAMSRHMKHRCKIANSEEGMGKLLEHTIQRQLAVQSARIEELSAMVERLAAAPAAAGAVAATQSAGASSMAVGTGSIVVGTNSTVVGANSTVIKQVVNQVINIVPWDGDRRITVRPEEIAAAFEQNGRLREYTSYSDLELADHKIASPYVTELLMDLVKRSHADPAARNVYLNPRRADQALVHMRSGQWEVLPLADATRLLFDGVAETIHRTVLSDAERRRLPLEAQNALAIAGMLYEEQPDEYVERARGPMSAHLANTSPPGRDAA